MSNMPVNSMLERVRRRLWLMRLGRTGLRALLVAAGVVAAALLAVRLTGAEVMPEGAWWAVIAGAPVAAGLFALLRVRRIAPAEAAATIDRHLGSKDLFLTHCYLQRSPGRYQPLVRRQAEAAAVQVKPAAVVPIGLQREAGISGAALVALAVLVLLVPSLDPFGHAEEARRLADRKDQLQIQKKLAIDRAGRLAATDPQAELSKPVDQQLDELMRMFHEMKPQDPAGNLRRLQEQQKGLEELWKQRREDALRESLSNRSTAQRFGSGQNQQTRQWQDQLRQGDSSAMQEKVEQIRKQAEQLAKASDPMEKQQLRQEMKKSLEQLSSAAAGMEAGQALQNALTQAMQQLDMSSLEGLSPQALAAMQQSLSLSQMELEALAQNARDLDALQQAMQTAQIAQMLNQMQPLDGAACGSCQGQGMAAYMALYQQMLSQCQGQGMGQGMGMGSGSGSGGGMGGPGRGRGGVAPENEGQQTAFQTERSRSAISAGKMLLQWKTKEVAPAGEAVVEYRHQVAAVKQGVSEAVLHDEIPPGYHDAIRQYFDSLKPAGNEEQ